jgi:hypothetical protein
MTGALCGSSFINEAFRKEVMEILRPQQQSLERHHGRPLQQIIDRELMPDFEWNMKRKWKGQQRDRHSKAFPLSGLNAENGHVPNPRHNASSDVEIFPGQFHLSA